MRVFLKYMHNAYDFYDRLQVKVKKRKLFTHLGNTAQDRAIGRCSIIFLPVVPAAKETIKAHQTTRVLKTLERILFIIFFPGPFIFDGAFKLRYIVWPDRAALNAVYPFAPGKKKYVGAADNFFFFFHFFGRRRS